MTEQQFVHIINRLGGKAYIVGGWVRDTIIGRKPKDKDYVVTGVHYPDFIATFPTANQVGKSFPVFLLEIDGDTCEVAFARTERKVGVGYKGFEALYNTSVTIEQDLLRRDTTMNSIAAELPGYKFIDCYDGINDIKAKIITATSDHFKDDPVRALRAARQASDLAFSIDSRTIALMSECTKELKLEPPERLFEELKKVLKTAEPSLFFKYLHKADLLATVFPEIHALIGQTQPPEHHPEGDAFEHTMKIIDQLASTPLPLKVRFAGLMHDIGKGMTPKEKLPKHIGHDTNGLAALNAFANRIPLPTEWYKSAEIAIKHHMRVARMNQPRKIVEVLLEIAKNPIGIDGFRTIIFFDGGGVPLFLAKAEQILAAINLVKGTDAPDELQGKEIGNWLLHQRCMIVSTLMKKFD
ncbi:MAG: tRNA nucleotidyltransferase/poly(A) polymerase [Firmicutes bacterium]|nr:tRNA nucleotidyltransferase/poly(A) polymerase [Bacillota bacterium]